MSPHRIDADVCIVGGGSAGLTLAAELAGSGREVLVLERGPRRRRSRRADHETFEWDGASLPMSIRARRIGLGGDGLLWGGAAVEFDPSDFEPQPWRPGWPIGHPDLAPFYDRARRHLSVGSSRPTRDLGDGVTLKPIDRSPVRFGVDLPDRRVRLRTRTTRIVTRAGRVDHLVVVDGEGVESTVHPRDVVLAAGGVETPALLLASGVGPPLMGRFFADHPYLTIPFLPPPGVTVAGVVDREMLTPAHALWVLSDAVRTEASLPGAAAFLMPYRRPELWDRRGVEAWQDLWWARRKGEPPPRPLATAWRAAAGVRPVLRARRDQRTEWSRPALRVVVEPVPQPDSRVTLAARRDRHGLPVPRVDWRIGDREREAMERLVVGVSSVAERQGWGPLEFPEGMGWPARVESGHHHMGATRMGASAGDGVVDRDCRVFGVDNLFVAGPSVFPGFGYANPMLTMIALTIRLADHLAGRTP